MPHNMREMLRSYLKRSKATNSTRLLTATDALQEHVNQQIRQPMREDMSFVTRFINKKMLQIKY